MYLPAISACISLLLVILMSGCTYPPVLKVAPVNNSGYFETKEYVDEVKINDKVDINKYKKLLFVKSKYYSNDLYIDFLIQSFKNVDFFDKVMGKNDLELMLLQSGLANKVTNVSDLIGLHQVQEAYGDFLIVDCDDVRRHDGNAVKDYVEGNLKVIDPANGKVLLHLFKKKSLDTHWSGAYHKIYYPLFNGFIDWIHDRPIKTNPIKNKADETVGTAELLRVTHLKDNVK